MLQNQKVTRLKSVPDYMLLIIQLQIKCNFYDFIPYFSGVKKCDRLPDYMLRYVESSKILLEIIADCMLTA